MTMPLREHVDTDERKTPLWRYHMEEMNIGN